MAPSILFRTWVHFVVEFRSDPPHNLTVQVVIGLGGNLGNVEAAFQAVRRNLASRWRIVASAKLYRTRPVGPSQPDFLNSALRLEGNGGLSRLLEECRTAEVAAGRKRATEIRWGPRTLDIDLLLVRGGVRRGLRLEVPHPRFHERAFAILPAADVAPRWIHPLLGRTVGQLVDDLGRDSLDEVEAVDSVGWFDGN